MEVNIEVYPFGIFAFHNNNLILKEEFKSGGEAASFILEIQKNLEKFIEKVREKVGEDIVIKKVKEDYSPQTFERAMEFGVFEGKGKFREFIHSFFTEFAKLKIKGRYREDKIIIHLVNGIDELNRIINLLFERVVELYGLYFPEAVHKIQNPEKVVRIIAQDPSREAVASKIKIPTESMGFELPKEDLEILKLYARATVNLLNLKNTLTNRLKNLMSKIAPNLSKVATPMLGARLIASAGSLENLTKLPSSTIQVLGAEKALFRHLRKGAKPPKHGYLISHPLLRDAKKRERGKIARSLASKIAIAAKIDFFSREDRSEELLKDLEERIRRIREKK